MKKNRFVINYWCFSDDFIDQLIASKILAASVATKKFVATEKYTMTDINKRLVTMAIRMTGGHARSLQLLIEAIVARPFGRLDTWLQHVTVNSMRTLFFKKKSLPFFVNLC